MKSPPSIELQRLWFATQLRPWSSLVLVPADPATSVAELGRALAEVGSLHRGQPVKVLTAEGVDVLQSSKLVIEMSTHVASGGVVILILDCPLANATSIPVALAADAALLCVELGQAGAETARKVMELIGKERFVGSVTLREGLA